MDTDRRPEILVGFAEAYAAIEATWSLLEAGFRVSALARSGERAALRHVRNVRIHPVTAPEVDAERTLADVRAVLTARAPAAYLPLDDASVWISSQLSRDEVVVAGPSGATAAYALDKERQLSVAREAGLLVPETTVVPSLPEQSPSAYPVVVKPARALYCLEGRLVRRKGMVCANDAEFRQAARTLSTVPMLVQPLITGVGEGLFGHMTDSGVVAWSAHRRLRMVNPEGSASSACVSRSVDPQIIGPAERFLRAIGWRGLFMLEFLRDREGRPWFMELNGRTWGSLALARRRGFEYPAWTVRAALDANYNPVAPANPPEIVCRNLGMELLHLAFVIRGPRSIALREWPRLLPTIRDLVHVGRNDRLYNWNRSEPYVLAADTAQTLRSYLGRALKAAR